MEAGKHDSLVHSVCKVYTTCLISPSPTKTQLGFLGVLRRACASGGLSRGAEVIFTTHASFLFIAGKHQEMDGSVAKQLSTTRRSVNGQSKGTTSDRVVG